MNGRTVEVPAAAEMEIDPRRLRRLLQVPEGHELEGRAVAVMQEARGLFERTARPSAWMVEKEEPALKVPVASGSVRHGMVCGVTLGESLDELVASTWDARPDLGLFLDALGSAAVPELLACVRATAAGCVADRRLVVQPHVAPGYPGWPLSDQGVMFDLLSDAFPEPDRPSLTLLPSGMLQPAKSMLAWFAFAGEGSSDGASSPCASCTPDRCECLRMHQRTTSGHAK